jgi:hypothetical protein
LTVALASKKTGRVPGLRIVCLKYTYGNGDTSIVAQTGLKIVYSWAISAASVTTKLVDIGTVAGGAITLTVADPLADAYIYVTAYGI